MGSSEKDAGPVKYVDGHVLRQITEDFKKGTLNEEEAFRECVVFLSTASRQCCPRYAYGKKNILTRCQCLSILSPRDDGEVNLVTKGCAKYMLVFARMTVKERIQTVTDWNNHFTTRPPFTESHVSGPRFRIPYIPSEPYMHGTAPGLLCTNGLCYILDFGAKKWSTVVRNGTS